MAKKRVSREAKERAERARKGWRTRRRHERERSERAKRAAITRKRTASQKQKLQPKPQPEEWAITYDYGETPTDKFTGELRFYSEKSLTKREALRIASEILKGEEPEKITVRTFTVRGKDEDAESGGFAFAEGFASQARKTGIRHSRSD